VKVCLDIQSAITQRAGVGRYAGTLAQYLAGDPELSELVLFYFDFHRRGLPFTIDGATQKAVRWLPGRAASLAWKTLSWPPYQRFAGGADLYHFPNFILPPLAGGKAVVTIHDMSFLRFPEFAENRNRQYLSARIADTAARADAIITDSRFSAAEIVELLKVDNERVFPIHLGIAGAFRRPAAGEIDRALGRLGIEQPYMLTVGTVEPRKNLPFMIDVFEALSADYAGNLVIAGMKGWKFEPILERIDESPVRDRIRHLDAPDDGCLPALYAGADVFLCTSFYEGFGLPPLESMACGTPVVSSTGGSLPEVLGDAARIVDGFDAEEWAAAVREILGSEGTRQQMLEAGQRRAGAYTWQATAARTVDVYKKVLET